MLKKAVSRRTFNHIIAAGTMAGFSVSTKSARSEEAGEKRVRLGGPVMEKFDSPESWAAIHKRLGYSAAYCPIDAKQSDDVVNAYAQAAQAADLVIAEVGAWSNPLDAVEEKSQAAIHRCQEQLALAERIGALCCVNISGSRGKNWAGPDPKNLTQETFDRIVAITREIIDAVKPTRTYYSLELMPWAYPDSPDSYLQLIKAIDRKAFAVHLDPANLMNSPRRFYFNAEIIKECFAKLGPMIRSCHGKDIVLRDDIYSVHFDEVRPGLGGLDYGVFLLELSRYSHAPLMLEHLSTAEEYQQAADFVRSKAKEVGVKLA